MAQDRDHKIRERAHAIWLEEGSPTGRHEEHWERATREVDGPTGNSKSSASGKTPLKKAAASKATNKKPADAPVDAAKVAPEKRGRGRPASVKKAEVAAKSNSGGKTQSTV